MKGLYFFAGAMLFASVSALADKQTDVPGQQTLLARWTKKPVTIDGVLGSGEWSAAVPVHVDAIRPEEAPGFIPLPYGINPPDNQDDSSYKIYAMYDENNLYIAVDVADDKIISDNPEHPWLDDDVEIFIDGDNQPFDMDAVNFIPDWFGVLPDNEGFQLVTSAGNLAKVYPSSLIVVDWESKAGLRPRGFLIETRVSLDSINATDNSWFTNPNLPIPDFDNDPTKPLDPNATFNPAFRRPQPGDRIGFNVVVADDDCGLHVTDPLNLFDDSLNRTDLIPNPSSYTVWDGSSSNYYYADESAWGTLYLVP